MRRLKSGRGRGAATSFGERGARGRASHARSREAPHSRPPARRPAAPALGLHAAEMKGRREPLRIGPNGGPVSARKSGGGCPKPPHVERRVASAPIARRAAAHQAANFGSATRRSIPSHFFAGGDSPRPPVERGNRDDGVPGAAKNTGDAARLPRSRSSPRKRGPSCESVLDSRFRGNERRLWRALEALSRPPLPW